jgi:hypothetical protein
MIIQEVVSSENSGLKSKPTSLKKLVDLLKSFTDKLIKIFLDVNAIFYHLKMILSREISAMQNYTLLLNFLLIFTFPIRKKLDINYFTKYYSSIAALPLTSPPTS